MAEHRGRQQSGLNQAFGVALAFGDEHGAAGPGVHDRRPVVDHAAGAGAEQVFAVRLVMWEEALALSFLARRVAFFQFIAVLLIERRVVGERVIECLYQLVTLLPQERVIKWFAGMLFDVGVACGLGLRAVAAPRAVATIGRAGFAPARRLYVVCWQWRRRRRYLARLLRCDAFFGQAGVDVGVLAARVYAGAVGTDRALRSVRRL